MVLGGNEGCGIEQMFFFCGDLQIVVVRCDYLSVGLLCVYSAGGEAALV